MLNMEIKHCAKLYWLDIVDDDIAITHDCHFGQTLHETSLDTYLEDIVGKGYPRYVEQVLISTINAYLLKILRGVIAPPTAYLIHV